MQKENNDNVEFSSQTIFQKMKMEKKTQTFSNKKYRLREFAMTHIKANYSKVYLRIRKMITDGRSKIKKK